MVVVVDGELAFVCAAARGVSEGSDYGYSQTADLGMSAKNPQRTNPDGSPAPERGYVDAERHGTRQALVYLGVAVLLALLGLVALFVVADRDAAAVRGQLQMMQQEGK